MSVLPYHFLLLGTKNDVISPLECDVLCIEGQKAAGTFFGPSGIARGTSADFMTVSSRTGENLNAVFPLLGREILRGRRKRRLGHDDIDDDDNNDGDDDGDDDYSSSSSYHHHHHQNQQNRLRTSGGWNSSDFDLEDDDDNDKGLTGKRRVSIHPRRRRWWVFETTYEGSKLKKARK